MVKRRQGVIWVLHQEWTREQRIPEKTVCLWEERYKQELLQDATEQRLCDREREIKIKKRAWASRVRWDIPSSTNCTSRNCGTRTILKTVVQELSKKRTDRGMKTEVRILSRWSITTLKECKHLCREEIWNYIHTSLINCSPKGLFRADKTQWTNRQNNNNCKQSQLVGGNPVGYLQV